MIFNTLIQIGLMKMASINSSDSFELKGDDHTMLQNMTTTTHEGVYNYIRINLKWVKSET